MRSRGVSLAVAAAMAALLYSGTARADLNDTTDNAIKGTIGCALLGANLTLIIEGAVGVRNPWLLSLVPIAVAGGGAAGGWFLGEASGEGAVASLVVGLALTVPAAVLVAWAQSYRASRDEAEGFVDRTEEGMPPEDEEARVEMIPDDGTDTEVVGPEDGETIPPPAEEPESYDEPADEPETEGYDDGASGPGFLSQLAPRPLPLSERTELPPSLWLSSAPRLSLTYF